MSQTTEKEIPVALVLVIGAVAIMSGNFYDSQWTNRLDS